MRITDYGTGMSRDEIIKLLNSDLKFTKPGTFQEPGTGLGFAFAKEMIKLNNGKLQIKSNPEEGTTIVIELKK